MLSKQVEKQVKVMLDNQQIPSSFEPMMEKVKMYADRAQGKQGLSIEAIAIILALCNPLDTEAVIEPAEGVAPEPETTPDPEIDEPEDTTPAKPIFMLGSKVSVYVEGELATGNITGLPKPHEKRRYRIKFEDDSTGYFNANEMFLAD